VKTWLAGFLGLGFFLGALNLFLFGDGGTPWWAFAVEVALAVAVAAFLEVDKTRLWAFLKAFRPRQREAKHETRAA
jgi:hypothetical protein